MTALALRPRRRVRRAAANADVDRRTVSVVDAGPPVLAALARSVFPTIFPDARSRHGRPQDAVTRSVRLSFWVRLPPTTGAVGSGHPLAFAAASVGQPSELS